MTLDEYNKQITHIYEELEQLSQKTAQQALAGSANTSNPLFNQIMERHAQLIIGGKNGVRLDLIPKR